MAKRKNRFTIKIKNYRIDYRYILAAICAVVLIIIIAVLVKRGPGSKDEEAEVIIVSAETSSVRHLSFPQLSLESGEGKLSVNEFSQILNRLYQEDFVLVDVYDLVSESKDGTLTLNTHIDLPEGKKPLIISQRDVSYPLWHAGNGYAEKLVVNTAGDVKCVYTDAAGDTHQGDYDLIPLLESFVKAHPDFSYGNARGIIGVTGHSGVLGYRTSAYLSSAAENPFGLEYDTAAETEEAAKVIKVLKKDGWHFASCGFNIVSYGSELSIMKGDVDMWSTQVADIVGGTDILIYPMQTDVGSWAPYSETNEKYNYLKDHGFRYFFIHETETPWFIQCTNSFMRQAVYEIDTFAAFEEALAAA